MIETVRTMYTINCNLLNNRAADTGVDTPAPVPAPTTLPACAPPGGFKEAAKARVHKKSHLRSHKGHKGHKASTFEFGDQSMGVSGYRYCEKPDVGDFADDCFQAHVLEDGVNDCCNLFDEATSTCKDGPIDLSGKCFNCIGNLDGRVDPEHYQCESGYVNNALRAQLAGVGCCVVEASANPTAAP
jgi:hypothetical protein